MPLNNELFSSMEKIPKSKIIKWVLFLAAVYGLYDGVYEFADSKRLMLDMADVTSGLMPIVAMHIDLPIVLGAVVICLIFDRRQLFSVLAIRSKGQMLWMAVGALAFVAAVYLKEPVSSVDVYEILHALIVVGLVEELFFRGFLFSWLDKAGCGKLAYLLSGMAWGASFGIRSIVVSGTSTLMATLPMAIVGAVLGIVIAVVYKKCKSLWLVAYLHGAISLL